ncbi:MAG TPA: hypothetical protein VGK25_12475 [Ignavibacteria bacterium]|jgi:hypothetical protein
MIKYFTIIYLIFVFASAGCSFKKDIKPDAGDTVVTKTEAKSDLSELEIILEGYNYEEVIEKFSHLQNEGFSVTRYKYFVIFSELEDNLTRSLIVSDIKNTINAMMNHYVDKIPENITPIIFFEDYKRYKKFALSNYDIPEHDLSPYGFYKISKNVIVIKYVSWKGSTAHEVTHRFLRSDFSEIPSWFDEGFASLHERASYKNGILKGEFSWRIAAIRRAFENKTYTGLRTLMEANDNEFYGTRTTFYYAQARYLLMYLQEKDLLRQYYELFRETYKMDETGITQLEKVLDKPLSEIDDEYLEYLKGFED